MIVALFAMREAQSIVVPTASSRRCGRRRPLTSSLRSIALFWLMLWSLVFAMATPVFGQEVEDDPTELWLSYEHQQKVTERVRVSGTLGYRELVSDERFFGEWTQLHLKVDASYEVNPTFHIAGGVGAYATYRPDLDELYELRLWQEAKAFWPDRSRGIRRFVLAHRFRLEERFLESGGWDFAWRFRYRLGTKIALNRHDLEPGSFYLSLAAELFADLGSGTSELFADRGRASIGLGYVIGPNWTLDLRFHSQRSRVTVEDEFLTNGRVVDFTVKTSVRIRDLVKGR